MKIKLKIYLLSYIVFSILMITLGYFYTKDSGLQVNFHKLHLKDAALIFGFNYSQILIWLLLSPILLSLPLIGKFLFSIGEGPQLTSIDAHTYYLSSLTHGLGELVVGFLVYYFTIEQLLAWIHFFRTRDNTKLKELYLYSLKKVIPLITIILIFSALCEVYISNTLFLKFK
ncbi:hypothetical protein [Priestia sp. TGN 0903]|uniref:hypothetical protein n=1 Tax=Priestia sp. TGN 0903 TaxID=3420730 RepID=UPI003D7722AD